MPNPPRPDMTNSTPVDETLRSGATVLTRRVLMDRSVTLLVRIVEHRSGGNCLRFEVVTSERGDDEDDEQLAIYAPLAPAGEADPSTRRRWKRHERRPSLPIAMGAHPDDTRSRPGSRQARWAAVTSRRLWAPVALGAVVAGLAGVTVLNSPAGPRPAEMAATVPSSPTVTPSSDAVITPSSPHSSSSSTACGLLSASGWIGGLYRAVSLLPGPSAPHAAPFSPADCLEIPSGGCTIVEFRSDPGPAVAPEQTR